MNRTFFARSFALALCAACACVAASAQQPRPRRGGLDNLSLTSRPPGGSAADSTAGWQTFSPEGAGFSVMLPGTPEDTMLKGRRAGTLNAQLYDFRLKAEGLDYEIVRTGQFPKEVLQGDFSDKFFEALPQNLAQAAQVGMPQMKLQLAGERPVELGGYTGREYEFSSEEYRSQVRVFIVDRALLLVGMTGPKSVFSQEKLRAYYDSFTLTP